MLTLSPALNLWVEVGAVDGGEVGIVDGGGEVVEGGKEPEAGGEATLTATTC